MYLYQAENEIFPADWGFLQVVKGYLPKDDGAKLAFKDADIIVIPAGIPRMYTISNS